MTNFIKDVFKVHNLVAVYSLGSRGGRKTITPELIAKRFSWTEAHTLDAIKIFRAIEPSAMKPTFQVMCACKAYTNVDNYTKDIVDNGVANVQCATCKKNIKVTVANVRTVFSINKDYATSREDFI